MSTNNHMTQEQLDAIEVRADAIRARVDAITGSGLRCSYPWPDPTDERIKELEKENAELRNRLTVDEDMVERAARESWCLDMQGNHALWDKLPDEKREPWRNAAYIALDAALNPGEGS